MLNLFFPRQQQTVAIALCALLATACQQANSASNPSVESTTPANSLAVVDPTDSLANATGSISTSPTPDSSPAPAPQAPAPIAQSPAPAAESNPAGQAVYTEYRNEERSIVVTSAEPWSGKNGTGNFSFQRCEFNGDGCDEVITGGKAACNETVCEIVWDGAAKHSISERRFDSEAIATYTLILNNRTVANDEDVTRYSKAFF